MHIDRIRGHSFVGDWIDRSSLVVDLGMNEGLFSKEMQERFGCRVIGVEANPVLASKVRNSLGLECFNFAIAPVRGDLRFYVDADNSEASSLTPTRPDRVQSVQVPGLPLADFLDERGIGEVDLLKIDIEGAETELLLETDIDVLARVKQICVEFHIFLFEKERAKVGAVLDRLGAAGFFYLDCSRQFEDTLLVNQRFHPLSQFNKMAMHAQKYGAGAQRMIGRSVARFR